MDKSLFFNRKSALAILTLFVFVFAFQMAEPASAATLISHGYKSFYTNSGDHYKLTWNVYRTGTYTAVDKLALYSYDDGSKAYLTCYIKKISSTKVYVKSYMDGRYYGSFTATVSSTTSVATYAKSFVTQFYYGVKRQ
ncbi:hypothetical protein [Methanobacterium sp.]|uniref:hypothetical protein n=1 Tax=Methanobacterium sp. TaxID=2164 RepID=UPI003C741CD4